MINANRQNIYGKSLYANSRLNRETDPLKSFISKVKEYAILTKEEEIELVIRFNKNNDFDAYNKLVMAHAKLVLKIAFKYYRLYNVSLFDLVQEGNLGVVMAVRKFDLSKKVRFSTYAMFWIRAYILKYLMDNYSIIRIGQNKAEKKLFYSLKKAQDKLQRDGENPNDYSRISEMLNIDEKKIIEMNSRINKNVVSLDKVINNESNTTVSDFVPDDDVNIEQDAVNEDLGSNLQELLMTFYKKLNNKEKFVWDNRIVIDEPLKLKKIGSILNLSRERIRQITIEVKEKLKKYLVKHNEFAVEDYLN